MKLQDIVHAVSSEEALVIAALDALKEASDPQVEECDSFQQQRTLRLTGTGVRFVRNVPQGLVSREGS